MFGFKSKIQKDLKSEIKVLEKELDRDFSFEKYGELAAKGYAYDMIGMASRYFDVNLNFEISSLEGVAKILDELRGKTVGQVDLEEIEEQLDSMCKGLAGYISIVVVKNNEKFSWVGLDSEKNVGSVEDSKKEYDIYKEIYKQITTNTKHNIIDYYNKNFSN